MTREEILTLAQASGFNWPWWTASIEDMLERFAKAVALQEREECAKVCDARAAKCAAKAELSDNQDDRTELKANAWQFGVLGAEIRARGEK